MFDLVVPDFQLATCGLLLNYIYLITESHYRTWAGGLQVDAAVGVTGAWETERDIVVVSHKGAC